MLGFWKGFGRPTWGSGSALGVQVGVLGRLWASKLGSMGGFGQPNEAPKESFGPPKSVAKRLRMHFCNVMKNIEKPRENQCFCMVFPMLRGLQKALGPPSGALRLALGCQVGVLDRFGPPS